MELLQYFIRNIINRKNSSYKIESNKLCNDSISREKQLILFRLGTSSLNCVYITINFVT